MMKIIAILLLLFFSMPATAQEYGYTGARAYDLARNGQNQVDLEKYKTIIYRIEEYLSSFKTMEARFKQTVPGKIQVRTGRILLYRPGKARWEYNSPFPTVLTINDGSMSYYDKELDQITYGSVPPSPLKLLLKENIKLTDGVRILRIQELDGGISITLLPEDSKDSLETLTMVFSLSPLQLTRLQRSDGVNRSTTLDLSSPVFNVPLSPDLFSLKNHTKRQRKN